MLFLNDIYFIRRQPPETDRVSLSVTDGVLTITANNADVNQIIRMLNTQAGISIVAAPNVIGTVDEIVSVGGNYVRNTMSQREQIELKPHKLLPDGKFDLNQWNAHYWNRFQNMLRWT